MCYSKRLSAKSSQVPEELNFGLHILLRYLHRSARGLDKEEDWRDYFCALKVGVEILFELVGGLSCVLIGEH